MILATEMIRVSMPLAELFIIIAAAFSAGFFLALWVSR